MPSRASQKGRTDNRQPDTDTSFARPQRSSPRTAPAYFAAIKARVGDGNPMTRLARAPNELTNAIAGLSDTDAQSQPEADHGSVLQSLRHLSDCEMVYGHRMRLIVADHCPEISGFAHEAWPDWLHSNDGTPAEVPEDLSAQRARTLRGLATRSDDELERVGVKSERGDDSVRHLVLFLAGHDLVHLAQIERARHARDVEGAHQVECASMPDGEHMWRQRRSAS